MFFEPYIRQLCGNFEEKIEKIAELLDNVLARVEKIENLVKKLVDEQKSPQSVPK